MKDLSKEQSVLSKLMAKSNLEMPFNDFDETVMTRIQKINIQDKAVSRDEKWSFIFFILGTFLGLLLNSLLQFSELEFSFTFSDTIILIFQTIFVLLFLTQFEKHVAFIKKWMRQERT